MTHYLEIFIAGNAIIAVGLALLVAVIARVWRNPAVLHLLWILVLVKLFAPPLFGVPVAKLDQSPSVADMMAIPALPVEDTPVEAVPSVAATEAAEPREPAAIPAFVESFSFTERMGEIPWRTIVSSIWALGTILCVVIGVRRIVRFSRQLRQHASRAPEAIYATAEKLCEQIDLRYCPEILTIRAKIPPVVWLAGGRTKIVLPLELIEKLEPVALEAILLHELSHVKRKDSLIRWLEMAATMIFWWHPVVWWARREIRTLEEQCCDATVLRIMPQVAKEYAAALVDALDFLSPKPPMALPTGSTSWQSTSINAFARRITMLKNPRFSRLTAGSLAVIVALVIVPMSITFAAAPVEENKPKPPSKEKAELMGRVTWMSLHSGRDVTAVKSLEWGEPKVEENGNRSIRHKFYATIWDKEVVLMNAVFTFDPEGNPVGMKQLEGFPKKIKKEKADTTTKNGMIALVRKFFTRNFRDISSRDTVEWGEPEKDKDGNISIRYQYEATIRGKEIQMMNQIFTFSPEGKFVDVKNVDGFPKKIGTKKFDTSTQKAMIARVEDFFKHNWRDITSKKTIEWGERKEHENGNVSIRYKFEATIWNKDKKIMDKIFTFTSDGAFVDAKNAEESPKDE